MMKKLLVLMLVLSLASIASAGTMVISGLPSGDVDTTAGDTVLSFDIVSNGQLDNDSLYCWTYTGGTLDIDSAINNVVADEVYDDSPIWWLEDYGIDTTNISSPIVWADIAIPKVDPYAIVGDIISDLGLTIAQGFIGDLVINALSENSGEIEGTFTVHCVPEPMTIALLGLGGLFLRRRK